LKVGIVTYALNIGGVERVILNLYQGLLAHGYQPTIIEIMKKGEWSEKFQSMGLQVEQVLPSQWESKKKHAFRILNKLKEYRLLFLNDVQYAHSILGFLPPATRVFPIVHGNLESMLFNASFNISQIQNILCVNPILAERLTKEYAVPQEMIHVVPNCLDTQNISHTTTLKTKEFVYLGRLNDFEKGVMDIPEIMKIVSENFREVQLDIYGSGTHEEALRNMIRSFGLEGNISLKGELDPEKVHDTLSHYKYLIFPSKFESGALVLKEAMLNGLIPFAYRLPGQTDVIVTHGKNGFLAEPGNISEFAAHILALYTNQELVKEISENAVSSIQKNFSLKVMMHAYQQIIDLALKSPDPQRSGRLEIEILEEFTNLPLILIRPFRKILRGLGLYK
tara:strand:+ start:60693 stop:61871 length:1179 start_codon:yes stop_codon:yes gene_type:complete